MVRAFYLLFGVVAYLIFFATFLYLVGFTGDFPQLPRTVDRGGPAADLFPAVLIDLGLIALFGLQHSVMARPGFKRAWTRIVPAPIERSLYVLLASLMLVLLFWQWRPIAAPVWAVESALLAYALWALFAIGWAIVLVSTFLISHFELFGLAQVWNHAGGTAPPPPAFRTPLFYKRVRHPLYSGFILAFFATPAMSVGHLVFALGMLAYILVAIVHEERDLIALFGKDYAEYRGRAGKLVPKLGRRA